MGEVGGISETPNSPSSKTNTGEIIGGIVIPKMDAPDILTSGLPPKNLQEEFNNWYQQNHSLQSLPDDNPAKIAYVAKREEYENRLKSTSTSSSKAK